MTKAFIISLAFICCWINIYQFFNISTYGITPADISAWIILLYALYTFVWKGNAMNFLPGWASTGLFLILFAEYASVINPLLSSSSDMHIQWLKTTVNFLYKWIFIFTLATGLFDGKDFKSAIRFALILSIGINMFGIYQIFARAFDLPFAWIAINNVSISIRNFHSMDDMTQLSLRFENFYRATSIFSEPSHYAQFNTFILAFVLVPFMRGLKPFIASKYLITAITMLAITGMFLTFSLTALFSLFFIIAYIVLFEKSEKKKTLFYFMGIAAALIVLVDSIVSNFVDISVFDLFSKRVGGIVDVLSTSGGRGTSIDGESFFGRLETIFQGFEIWTYHPITGIGAGCYEYFSKVNPISFSDSLFSGILAELGLLGFGSYVIFELSLFKSALELSRNQEYRLRMDPEMQTLTAYAPYSLIALFAFSFSAYYWISWIFWIHHGLVFSIVIWARQSLQLPLITFNPIKNGIKKRLKTALIQNELP